MKPSPSSYIPPPPPLEVTHPSSGHSATLGSSARLASQSSISSAGHRISSSFSTDAAEAAATISTLGRKTSTLHATTDVPCPKETVFSAKDEAISKAATLLAAVAKDEKDGEGMTASEEMHVPRAIPALTPQSPTGGHIIQVSGTMSKECLSLFGNYNLDYSMVLAQFCYRQVNTVMERVFSIYTHKKAYHTISWIFI